MKYNLITNTDLNPSIICLGTANFGSTIDAASSFALMDAFVDCGGTFIDTANIYGDWEPGAKSPSEKLIGQWLQNKKNRKDLIIATKGAHPAWEALNIPRLSSYDIVHDLNESLTHLQTDYIDLYWLHRDDVHVPVSEIMLTLNEQIKLGKIRAIGCSNWSLERLQEAQQFAAEHGLMGFVGNQVQWSLAKVNVENMGDKTMIGMDKEMYHYHQQTSLASIPYTSQANGFFSGKYSKEIVPAKIQLQELYYNDINFARMARVNEIAESINRSASEIVLAYLINQSFPVFPIVGSRTIEQLEQSVTAVDIKLDEAMLSYLAVDKDEF